jgi:hypothetical protein
MRRIGILAVSLALLAAGCSEFDNRWNNTPMPWSANPAAEMAGKWEGSWQSDSSNYSGTLQAMIVPTTTAVKEGMQVQQYQAAIKMYLFDFMSNNQVVTLNAAPGIDGKLHFRGKIDRGNAFGGIHYYDGYIDKDKFFCDYTSDQDCGTFKMHRLVGELQSQPMVGSSQ